MNTKLTIRTAAMTGYRVLNLFIILVMTLSSPLSVLAYSIDGEETAPPEVAPEESEPVLPEVLEPIQPEWTEPEPPDTPPGGVILISVRDGITSEGNDIDYVEGDPVSVEISGPVSAAYPGGYNPDCVEGAWDLTQGIWTCKVYLTDETAVDEYGSTYYIAEGDYIYDVYQNDVYMESGAFTDGPPKVEQIWQCDPPSDWDSTYTCAGGWTTGNNDGPIAEGEVIPYRTRFQNLIEGDNYSITIEWDTTKASKHALDYIASYDQTFPNADPCADLTKLPDGLCDAVDDTEAIPPDLFMQADADWIGTQDPGEFTIFGGTFDDTEPLSDYSTPANYDDDTSTSITVNFTANNTDVVLAWGGHIAERADWGQDNSAVYIPGSPYHMRLKAFYDGTNDETLNVGNMDLSLSAEAVIYPAKITIIKDAIPDHETLFNFTSTLGGFTLIDDGEGTDYYKVFDEIMTFGLYTFTESVPTGWSLTDITCTKIFGTGSSSVDLAGYTANINLEEADIFECKFTNELQTGDIIVDKITFPTEDPTLFTFTPDWDDPFELADLTTPYDSGQINAGVYSVAETVPVGWELTSKTCDDGSPVDAIDLDPGETVKCTFTNRKLSVSIDKNGDTLSKETDPVNYTITVENTSEVGTSDLSCRITDAMLGIDQTVILAQGASQIINDSYTVPEGAPDPLENTAYVECTFVGDTVVQTSDHDNHYVELFQPRVDVEKTGTEISKIGDVAYYTITVTNTSSTDSPNLENGTINDTLLGDLLDTENSYVTSSTCTTTLATGASCEINAEREIQEGDDDPLSNTVTVHYNPVGFENDITDSSYHEVDLVYPSIDVEKSGSLYSKTGDTITWTITIKNTGDVPLELDTLTDEGAAYTIPEACEYLEADDQLEGGLDECSFEATHVVTAAEGLLEEYVNTVSVLYVLPEMYGLDNEITDEDSFTTDIVHPDIDVEKSGSLYSKTGDTITWTITIKNTGDVPLELNTLTDEGAAYTIPEACEYLEADDQLEGGLDECSFEATHVVTEAEGLLEEYVNTVSVLYVLPEMYGLDNEITDEDSFTTDILHPGINVEKSGSLYSKTGDTITWTITIKNTSDVPLELDTLTDEGAAYTIPEACEYLEADDQLEGGLDECSFEATHVVTAAEGLLEEYVNTVSVLYVLPEMYGLDNEITDEDSFTTDIVHPDIDVEKSGSLYSKTGDTITWTITIKNTGDVPLELDTLTDEGAAYTIPEACEYLEADDQLEGGLDECSFEATHVVTAAEGLLEEYVNTVSVLYVLPEMYGLDNEITDEDSFTTDIVHPDIDVEKSGSLYSKTGDTITWTITIKNTGDVPLELDTLTDEGAVYTIPEACEYLEADDQLEGGLDECSFEATHVVTAAEGLLEEYVNTVSVLYVLPEMYGLDNEITDEDSFTTDIVHPDIDVEKSGSLYSKTGDTITWTITIKNTGDVPLELDTLTDEGAAYTIPEACEYLEADDQLEGGLDECSFEATHVVTAAEGLLEEYVNTVSVLYVLPEMYGLDNEITDEDSFTTDILHPDIDVEKSGSLYSKTGDTITWTITIKNTGDVPLELDTLTDEGAAYTIPEACEYLEADDQLEGGLDECSFEATHVVTEAEGLLEEYVNTVSVLYVLPEMYGLDNEITDEDSFTTDILHPDIDVEKSGSLYSKTGDTITWTITIKNTGDVPLELNTLTDEGAAYTIPEACEYLEADDQLEGGLDECSFEATHVVTEAEGLLEEYVNTVSVLYVLPEMYGLDNEITDEDSFTTDIVHPDIDVEKSGSLYSKTGDTITWTITIKNTGDVPLELNTLTDEGAAYTIPEACEYLEADDQLEGGLDECSFEATHVVTEAEGLLEEYVNTVSVLYVLPEMYGLDNEITDEDSFTTDIVHPSFTIEKVGDEYSKYDTLADVPFGDVIDYTLTLENTGDVDLILGDLDDSLEPTVALSTDCAELTVGETCVFTYSHTVTATEGLGSELVNVAEVSYELPEMYALDNIITESDSWTTTLLHPDFEVTKDCASENLIPGDPAVFGITLSNLGDADLVFVADEDLYDEVSMTTILAGTPIPVAVGETLYFTTEVEGLPDPDSMAMISNTVHVTVTLAAEYDLSNSWMAEATGECQYYYWAFTPGFWKNHTSSSPSDHDAWQYTAYDPGELLVDVGFILGELGSQYPKGSEGSFSTLTLLQALRLKGGAGIVGAGEILLRAGVASLLNASFHETMWGTVVPYFPMTSAEVIEAVNTAIATVDPVVMLELAAELDGYNNGYEYFDWTWPVP